ncbi:MAG TPA: AmmeMemoRadiSam system radical SAM enzyme [Caldithrix sp.]|nr:AmmeMemoRadiSam system radical SAM enzyme [Caldithrix sp.]
MAEKKQINRREFLESCGILTGAAIISGATPFAASSLPAKDEKHRVEARWYEKQPHKKVKCKLCPRECVVDDRERGYCGVRENWNGVYYTLVHSRPCTYHIDPIEKKPLFHFLPGTIAYSLATVGCNVDCKFCQNWQISQIRPEQVDNLNLPPEKVVREARRAGAPTIAYTYTEPVIFSEYMLDTAAAGRKAGVKSVMISNGYIQAEPMTDLCQVLDAVKIDLKAITEKFYREVVAGELKPVLDTLVLLRKLKMWTEIVYLVVPTLNDSDAEFRNLARWIRTNLGKDVPLHFSRFYPQYKLQNLPPTPVKTLERAHDICQAEGLHYVYIGNVPGHRAESTYCPYCSEVLIRRRGYLILENRIVDGKCPNCQATIPGIWH